MRMVCPTVFSPALASPLLPPPAGGRFKTVVTWRWWCCASKSSIPDNVYPSVPRTPGLREEIEAYLNEHGLQVVWYDD